MEGKIIFCIVVDLTDFKKQVMLQVVNQIYVESNLLIKNLTDCKPLA